MKIATVAVVAVCLLIACGVRAQLGGGDDYDEDAMMQNEGMPPSDGPREKVTIGVLKRPATCDKKVEAGSRVAVDLTLTKLVPSDTKAGEMEKVAVFSKKKLIVAGSGRFIEGVEEGIMGACVGEKRSLRIPASLGFAEEGNKKLNILPDTDLRAVLEVEDVEAADPYGEGMDDMSPDEDMEEYSGGEDGHPRRGGEGDEDDEDEENESLTGPHIADEDFEVYVPKTTTAQLRHLVGEGKKTVFVMFYAPWCGHCTAVKPKFAKVARAFLGDASKVAVVGVDATQEEELAQEYGVEGFPTFFLIPAGRSPAAYNDARTTLGMVTAINDAAGTERLPNGRLTLMAGTVAELNAHVQDWLQGTLTLADLSNKLPDGSYYKRVVESITTHGKPYVAKEKLRLEKVLTTSSASLKADQVDSMQRRHNILNVFDDERQSSPLEDGM
jgi:protein disulfide-isomerase-like protein